MIKFVLLDVDNTLLDFDKCAEYAIKCSCAKAGIEFFPGILKAFHTVNNGLWRQIETGEITKKQLHQTRWNKIFEILKTDFDGEVFEKFFLEYLCESSEQVDGAKELLEYLSEKYRLFTASNAFYKQQVGRMTKSGLIGYIEDFFISEKIGYEKPSKQFFDACFEKLGNPKKEEVIIIGDSVSADMRGGVDYGIKTCWYNPLKISPPDGLKIDFTVDDLRKVMRIL